jgi:hypothetical protein
MMRIIKANRDIGEHKQVGGCRSTANDQANKARYILGFIQHSCHLRRCRHSCVCRDDAFRQLTNIAYTTG